MDSTYSERDQTAAKHFILRNYLKALALITLQWRFSTLTYVDGFSGPWNSRKDDYSDTSFTIAIKVLREIQWQMRAKGLNRTIKCFFVEKDAKAFAQLDSAVRKYDRPDQQFHVDTLEGRFEDAVPSIISFAEGMTLTFIDPTGWTEYPFDRVEPLLKRPYSETLVNFMYDHISRFTSWDNQAIVKSFDGILRPGWRDRVDRSLAPGEAAERLFRQEFKAAGSFEHVVSTPIKKLSNRTHFCITYGTRHSKGLEVYRSVEHQALQDHEFRRLDSRLAKVEASSGQTCMFKAVDLDATATLKAERTAELEAAMSWLQQRLRRMGSGELFMDLWPHMLELFMLRLTDAKDVCAELANRGVIEPTWKTRSSRCRKPDDTDLIVLRSKESASANCDSN
jgi:three-Cys-motif partner protein